MAIHFMPIGPEGGLWEQWVGDFVLLPQPEGEWAQAWCCTAATDWAAEEPTLPHPSLCCPSQENWWIWIFTADVRLPQEGPCHGFSVEITTHHGKKVSVCLSTALACLSTVKQGEQCNPCGNLSLRKGQSHVAFTYEFKIYRVSRSTADPHKFRLI